MKLGIQDIEDAQIISEEPLADSMGENGFISWIAGQVDNITANNRGSWVTEALILADYDTNEEQLRSAYEANKPAIDHYFANVDVEKVINDVAPGVQEQITQKATSMVKNNVPGFLAGTLLTAATIYGIKKYKNS